MTHRISDVTSDVLSEVLPDFRPLRVARRTRRANGIVEFELVAPHGATLPRHTAGAHLPVEAPNGMRRNYSIVNPPPPDPDGSGRGPDHYLIAVKREPDGVGRGGSASMVDELREGSTLLAGDPVDGFPLVNEARALILIAGGIGITPILCMARALLQWQASGERAAIPFQLHYLARDAATAAYVDDVAAMKQAGQDAHTHFDGGDPAAGFDLWPLLETPRAGTHVYCCGPKGLMDAVRDMTGHWNPGAIHFESFGVGDATQFEPNQAFQVRLARAGDIIPVAVDESILDALRNHGHRVQSSCESGTCGTCRTVYLEGDVEHRDMVLADEEKGEQLMVCVSRARGGELVLDL